MNLPDAIDGKHNDNPLRLFIGIACPASPKVTDLLNELKVIAFRHNAGIRVVAENNLHITLKFLGSTPFRSVTDIAEAVDHVATGTLPFTMTLAGAGIFKDAFWLGVSPCNPLMELAASINQGVESLGFPTESRPFIPHLTVARINQQTRNDLLTWLQRCNDEVWGNMQVQEVHLYQSETLPTGVQYSVVHTARFKPSI